MIIEVETKKLPPAGDRTCGRREALLIN